MAFSYIIAAKQIALRAGQFIDAGDAPAIESEYTGTPLEDLLEGMEIPYTALKEMILGAEKRIVELISRSPNKNYRRQFYGRTADVVPFVDLGALEFIGDFGNPLDSINNKPLTEKTKQEVARLTRPTRNVFRLEKFHFCIEDSRIYHTRAGVYFEGCSWSYQAQATAFDAAGNSRLPQALETFLIAEVLTNAAQEEWFAAEAEYYSRFAEKCENQLLSGIVPSARFSDSTVTENPVKN
jgi:hypothetical protein